MRSSLHFISGILLAALLPAFVCAQNKKETDDRYVRLMSAQSVSTIEEDGKTLRKAEGPARFLHNDTWLICDTAIWDVDLQVIYALGNVSIEQENTELRSDRLTYFIERDIAEFRGSVVELIDKDQNILRTRHLDYNTKDSVAVFCAGASMKDKDGQIIESTDGTYESKLHLFTFEKNVNMFSDSVFVKTSRLLYDSERSLATFPNYVDAWNEDRMMSGGKGYYDNKSQVFFMTDKVHSMNDTQEAWCDSLYFYRGPKELEMLGNAQLTDSVKAVTGLAGYIHFRDSLSTATMKNDPLMLMRTEETDDKGETRTDTTYIRADILKYWKLMHFQVDSLTKAQSAERMKDLNDDPVANMRKKAAEEAERRLQEALENDPNAPPGQRGSKADAGKKPLSGDDAPENPKKPDKPGLNPGKAKRNAMKEEPAPEPEEDTRENPEVQADSLAAKTDSLSMQLDTLPKGPAYTAADSVELGNILGVGNVKVFRKSMQMVCDSLVYSDLDSLVRLYINPVVWNSPQHQYNADSIFVMVKNGAIDRANLLSDAFIQIEEKDSKFYDQIKSTEMTAFFDANGQLRRFDALGGANALFYIKEKTDISLANRSEATMLSATFDNGELSTISYYENPASNAFPVAQMKREDQFFKGFTWVAERRPKQVSDLSRTARKSQRAAYRIHPRAKYTQTDIYFPGYMQGIYRQIEISDSLKAVREENERIKREEKERLEKIKADSLAMAAKDSLSVGKDSLSAGKDTPAASAKTDSLNTETVSSPGDSLSVKTDSLTVASDSLGAVSDSLGTVRDSVVKTEKQIKAELRAEERARKKAEREARQAEKQARLEEKWAEQDAKRALIQAARDAKRRKKEEKRLKAQIERYEKEKAREDALIQKYRQKYLKKNL